MRRVFEVAHRDALFSLAENLTNRLKRSADEIGKQQAQRAVQDWFSYCARASHGVDKESGGADMTGG